LDEGIERLPPREAAKQLGVAYPTLKQWIYSGKIRTTKTLGGHHRISRAEIERINRGEPIEVLETEQQQQEPVEKKKAQILLVDDVDDTRLLLAKLMRDWGHQVAQASTCTEALSYIEGEAFDLYVIDNRLPDGNGIDLCRRIRARDPEAQIIFYSAVDIDTQKREAMEAGAQTYLIKPSDFDLLQGTIKRLLDTRAITAKASDI